MTTMIADTGLSNLFDEVLDLPNAAAKRRFDALVGLDQVKDRLTKQASLLLNPNHLSEWSERCHGDILPIVSRLRDRVPLMPTRSRARSAPRRG